VKRLDVSPDCTGGLALGNEANEEISPLLVPPNTFDAHHDALYHIFTQALDHIATAQCPVKRMSCSSVQQMSFHRREGP